MQLRKYRWSKVYESSEEELQALLEGHPNAQLWTGEAFETIEPRAHTEIMQLWCAEGSLTLWCDGKSYSLQPGDALVIPADTSYKGDAGISGFICYQTTETE